MSRQKLSRIFGLLLLASLFSAVIVTGTSTATASEECPVVSCDTVTGLFQCTEAGCTCGRNGNCVGIPEISCPVVSCMTTQGYITCKHAGCGCNPRTGMCEAPVEGPG